MPVADPDAIHAVREQARADIGRSLASRTACPLRRAARPWPVPDRRRLDRSARAAQSLSLVPSRLGRGCGRGAREGAVRRRAEHDGRARGPRRAVRDRLPGAHRGSGRILCGSGGTKISCWTSGSRSRPPRRCPARFGACSLADASGFRPRRSESGARAGEQLRRGQSRYGSTTRAGPATASWPTRSSGSIR